MPRMAPYHNAELVPSKTDAELVSYALRQWANYIETGEVYMSAQNAISSNQRDKLRALDPGQHRLVARLHDLADHYDKIA